MKKGIKHVVEFDHKFDDGYRIIGIFNVCGWRCGFVSIPENSLLYSAVKGGVDIYDIFPASCCHGGITFVGDLPSIGAPEDLFVGFDCVHFDDGYDISGIKKYFGNTKEGQEQLDLYENFPEVIDPGTAKSKLFVMDECLRLMQELKLYEK